MFCADARRLATLPARILQTRPPNRQRDGVMAEITSLKHLNRREERSYPRVVKRARRNSYPVKKPGQHGTRHDASAAIKLLNPVLARQKISTAALPRTR